MVPISEPFVPGLASLIYPHDPARFLSEVWQQKALYVPGTAGRLGRLSELLFEFDLARILAAADLRATLVQPALHEQRRRKGGDLLPAPMPEARTLRLLYELGNQLYIATSSVAGVEEWIERLSDDLGRVLVTGRGDVYATRVGGGADVHFDQNDNFTIQLTGHKVWRYSTERYLAEPLHNSGDLDPVPYEPTYTFDSARAEAGAFEEVVLGPGDMFYMPRAVLHATRAEEDSLSFNLSLGPQPWVEVLLDGLRARLVRDPDLRRGATRDPAAARASLLRFRAVVATLEPTDLLAGLDVPSDRETPEVRRNPLAWWSCTDHGGAEVTVDIHTAAQRSTALEVSREVLPLLKALPDDGRAFDPTELPSRFGFDPEDGRELVAALVDAGLLRWLERG